MFLKALGAALYERVFKAYKTTFIAILLVSGTVLIEQLQLAALPSWAQAVVGVAAAVLALYKGKQPPALGPVK